eukprot:42080-Eustigmatos_ZCMA.PRE.1
MHQVAPSYNSTYSPCPDMYITPPQLSSPHVPHLCITRTVLPNSCISQLPRVNLLMHAPSQHVCDPQGNTQEVASD